MKKTLSLVATVLACSALSSWAQIIIGGGLSAGPLTFDAAPVVADGWSTRSLPGNGATYSGANAFANLDAAVKALDASSVATALGVTAGTGQNALAQYDSNGLRIYTRATSQAATLLMATVRNDSGSTISSLTINYTLAGNTASEDPGTAGHLVYYSTTGAAGSWVQIAGLSGNVIETKSTTVTLTWAAGTTLYIIWADDNGDGATDGFYAIDDFALTASTGAVPLSATLIAPVNGQVFVAPVDVTVTADAVGTIPATSVSIYTNGNLFTNLTAAPYTTVIPAMPPGTYTIQARAVNGTDPEAVSAVHTIQVRDPYVHFTGSPITETFDGMGATGTNTPIGWYVGAAWPANGVVVTAGDGSAGANSGILGWNYGTTDDSDRALGTAPTGADRNMAVRIQNNTSSNITAITFTYDGEVWRNYTNLTGTIGNLTNYVSVDGGATWIETTFNFSQPFTQEPPQNAINGNDGANRTAGIGGTINLPSPLGPDGVLIIRWFDFNGSGTDGGLALDNFNFSATLVPFEQFVQINSPTNGAVFAEGVAITVSASAGMANPVSSVEFYRDGVLIGTDTNSPFSVVYSNAVPGSHTLTAIARDGLGASVTNAAGVSITVNPNVLPSITITNPAPDSVYFVGVTVTNISASASDTDGTIAGVEFYVDGYRWVTDTSNPYGFSLSSLTAGSHLVAAVAVDNAGGRTTNTISITATNPPDISVIVANGSDWKFLDDGSDQGTAWQTNGFSDAGWSNGIAEFGYGDGPARPERTVVSFGTNANTKHATTYFRKAFTVTEPLSFTNLILRLLVDDHAIVYLNGTQVFSDMTNAVVAYNTYEQPDNDTDGATFIETNIAAGLLIPGVNVLAVELHQNAANSSDISFDLMLWGQGNVAPAGPQFGFGLVGNNLVFSWPDSFTGFTLKETTNITANTVWQDSTLTPVQGGGKFTVTVPATGPRKYFELSK